MKSIGLILFICILASCSQKKEVSPTISETALESENDPQEYPAYDWDTLAGIYFGPFSDKEININLTYVSEFNAVGYSVMNGLIRNILGKVAQNKDSVKLVLLESGEHPFDGTFYLNIHKTNFEINGEWIPFDSKIKSKQFHLAKRIVISNSEFDYDAPLTDDHFLNFFSYSEDSLGSYTFSEDGSVTYQFYDTPYDYEEKQEGTPKIARGSWSVKNKIVTIFWQPNFAFPSLKSQFKMIDKRNEEEFESLLLQGEGRIIYSSYGMAY